MGGGRAEPNSTEIEWQFDALDLRPVERWLSSLPSRPRTDDVPAIYVRPAPVRRLLDHYVDTEDWRIRRAGLVMRTRRREGAVEVTLKDDHPADAARLRQRLEATESLPSGELSDLGSDGPVGWRVAAVAGQRPLVHILEVRTQRQPFFLQAGGAEVAEVALDETTIVVGAGQPPAHLLRVEIEVAPDWVNVLVRLVHDLQLSAGLRPASLSKFEAGLLAGGVEVPGSPELGSVDIGPEATFAELAFAVVRRHLRVLLAREPGTRLGEDIEELHEMRVATRRLRAAIDLFADALPPSARAHREELRWLAAVLGTVRDLDVQLAPMSQMAKWSAGWSLGADDASLSHLRHLLELERLAARRCLLDSLDSARWERLAAGLVSMAREGPDRLPAGRAPAALVVPPLVAARHRAAVKASRLAKRSGDAADFHNLRIRCKRLRYSIEFTAGLYGSAPQRFVRRLTRLQDSLGLMQDAEVASTRLFALATRSDPGADVAPGDGLPRATVFVMGTVAEHYRAESRDLQRLMARRLGVLTGAAWRELAARMEHAARRAAIPTAGATAEHDHPAAVPITQLDRVGDQAPVPASELDPVRTADDQCSRPTAAPTSEETDMPSITRIVSWKPGQIDCFQVNDTSGVLYHFWAYVESPDDWNVENIADNCSPPCTVQLHSPLTVDVETLPGVCQLVVTDAQADGPFVHRFAQGQTATWTYRQLP